MIRVLMVMTGAVIAVVLAGAIAADPHLWGQLLLALDHQARSHGSQLNGQVQRLVTPHPRAGGTP